MTEHRDLQPGDLILDRYLPHLGADDREIARARLYDYVAWHLRVIMRQLREEAESRERLARDTIESEQPPP